MCSELLSSGAGRRSSGFSTDVSDTRQLSSVSDESGCSTDVSDKWWVKYTRARGRT